MEVKIGVAIEELFFLRLCLLRLKNKTLSVKLTIEEVKNLSRQFEHQVQDHLFFEQEQQCHRPIKIQTKHTYLCPSDKILRIQPVVRSEICTKVQYPRTITTYGVTKWVRFKTSDFRAKVDVNISKVPRSHCSKNSPSIEYTSIFLGRSKPKKFPMAEEISLHNISAILAQLPMCWPWETEQTEIPMLPDLLRWAEKTSITSSITVFVLTQSFQKTPGRTLSCRWLFLNRRNWSKWERLTIFDITWMECR